MAAAHELCSAGMDERGSAWGLPRKMLAVARGNRISCNRVEAPPLYESDPARWADPSLAVIPPLMRSMNQGRKAAVAPYFNGPAFPSPGGFDAAVDRYDDDERGSRVLAHMRTRAFDQFRSAFGTCADLLEIGSGTGVEAVRLVSEQRCRVALLDVSPRLLELAARRVREVRNDALLGAHLLRGAEVRELVATYGSASFDGAYSSFGPLNCEPCLEPVARGLAELVRPGGALVISVMNRWCLTEIGWFALRGRGGDATRRWRSPVCAAAYPGGPKDVTTWYHSYRQVVRAFSAGFRVEHAEALPLLWPPPYLDFIVARFERFFRAVRSIEGWAARQPLLRGLGDHLLFRLRRR